MEEKSYVLDTSVIIEKAVSKMVKEKKLSGKIIITRASLAELENQANKGQEIGFIGLEVIFLEFKELKEKLEFEKYFDPDTMSVHLREDTLGRAKRGKPGQWSLVDIGTEILTTLQVQKMAKEIVERARTEQKAFIEISRPGSTVVQFHTYRIVITKPSLLVAWEITAFRPINQLNV